ncbi:DUF3710 domain-containing protein [Gandjariella thermophila]|uniref:DUF3710 domain-containing protein n=1 Tax=Gandjariella thermophila TaxID=1931992 RepID=A0A4D4JC46_9PSEU|nr:DUF3710 domain-containing protein [Gandjariella thermophila]GDY32922.1 hypothetical protein GTS_45550 [Gandjariella thermophila]
MFGRRRTRGRHELRREAGRAAQPEFDLDEPDDEEFAEDTGGSGPFDELDAPEDGVARLDLGSVRLPVPDGAQLQVEIDPSGPVRAVHVVTPAGQLTVSAYAAPRSGGLWAEVSEELVEQLRRDGATVRRERGEWATELTAVANGTALRFIGVDGPRWMLRGVAAGPMEQAGPLTYALREVVRGTVVSRGDNPLPVRTPLPLELPDAIARHIQQQSAQA